MKGLDMKKFWKEFKIAANEFGTEILFYFPFECKKEKQIAKEVAKK